MKIIEEKKKNITTFGKISIGTVFRFNKQTFIKTPDFFSAENIEDYFEHTDIMEDIDDMYNDYCAYNTYCLSIDTHCPFSRISEYVEVEVVEAELHIV